MKTLDSEQICGRRIQCNGRRREIEKKMEEWGTTKVTEREDQDDEKDKRNHSIGSRKKEKAKETMGTDTDGTG